MMFAIKDNVISKFWPNVVARGGVRWVRKQVWGQFQLVAILARFLNAMHLDCRAGALLPLRLSGQEPPMNSFANFA